MVCTPQSRSKETLRAHEILSRGQDPSRTSQEYAERIAYYNSALKMHQKECVKLNHSAIWCALKLVIMISGIL